MFSDEQRKKQEQDRQLDNLIRQALRIDSDVMVRLWKIFDYDSSRQVYRVYEQFLTIYNSQDAFDAAVLYGLKYEGNE